jgi:hypothetical protein
MALADSSIYITSIQFATKGEKFSEKSGKFPVFYCACCKHVSGRSLNKIIHAKPRFLANCNFSFNLAAKRGHKIHIIQMARMGKLSKCNETLLSWSPGYLCFGALTRMAVFIMPTYMSWVVSTCSPSASHKSGRTQVQFFRLNVPALFL